MVAEVVRLLGYTETPEFSRIRLQKSLTALRTGATEVCWLRLSRGIPPRRLPRSTCEAHLHVSSPLFDLPCSLLCVF